MFLRPTRSDRCPATTTQMKPSTVWVITRKQQEIARHPRHRRAVAEDPRADDIAGRLLRHAQQRGQCHLLRLPLQHLPHRHALDALLVDHLLEDRGLENAEPDPQPDDDHDGAEEERNAPAPGEELIAGEPTERPTPRTFARNNPAGAPNCGQAERKPRFLSVRAHSIASRTEPPHSPPTPMPWTRRMTVSSTAPQMPMLS